MLAELVIRGAAYGTLGESLLDVGLRAVRDGARIKSRSNAPKIVQNDQKNQGNHSNLTKNPYAGNELSLAA